MASSSHFSLASSEKDLEAADLRRPSIGSSYDEGVIRITTLDDPVKNDLGVARSNLSKTTTRRTAKDLEAVLNTEFEVRWRGKDDSENPMNWTMLKKGYILFLVSMQTLLVVFYSTSYVSGSRGMMADFEIENQTTIILGMTTYLLGLAFGPLLLAPLSELYGRRPVYLLSLFLYFIFIIPACVAKNFVTILVVRFFGAFMGSVTISNAPGSLGDIFEDDWRTLAFSVFAVAPMNGPVIGPIVGGFVYQNLGWRWNNWIVLIAAAIFGLLGLTQPETYAPILLRQKAETLRKETGDERYMSRFCYKDGEGNLVDLLKVNLSRPIVMFTEPMCMFWAIYVAAVYGILYMCFSAYPVVFSEIRGWDAGTSGLAFVGMGIGTVLALLLEPLSRKIYNMHAIDPDTGSRPPEARIVLVLGASIIIPLSIFWFAWTCVPARIHWIWPILSSVPYAVGNVLVFLHANTYLVTSYDVYAASAMAGNALTRSILGGVMPLFGPVMYHRMGPNMAATTVGIIAAVLIPIPWVFYKWGKRIRMRSPMLQQLQKEKAERGE